MTACASERIVNAWASAAWRTYIGTKHPSSATEIWEKSVTAADSTGPFE